MTKIPIKERIALIMLLAVIVTNPLTSQYILQGILFVFDHLILYGAWVTMVTASYMLALLAWYYVKSDRANIPAKSKKTKSQAYIETN